VSHIGDLIRSTRKQKGISQVEVAKKIGRSSQFVANWEREASNPPLNIIRPVCEVIGLGIKEAKQALVQDYIAKLNEEV